MSMNLMHDLTEWEMGLLDAFARSALDCGKDCRLELAAEPRLI
jgi:hypothetical protein